SIERQQRRERRDLRSQTTATAAHNADGAEEQPQGLGAGIGDEPASAALSSKNAPHAGSLGPCSASTYAPAPKPIIGALNFHAPVVSSYVSGMTPALAAALAVVQSRAALLNIEPRMSVKTHSALSYALPHGDRALVSRS